MSEFPVRTSTSCPLKWAWSSISLNSGRTSSCHRTGTSPLTKENFAEFHNTPVKIQDRQSMLAGQWPDNNCGYCRQLEETGGYSDRMRHLTLPHPIPIELKHDHAATSVTPTIVEVYFNNTCNLACLYCTPKLSSRIDAENLRFGPFNKGGVRLINADKQFSDLLPEFWKWFPEGFPKLSRFNVLGGEPFLQSELDHLLHMISQYPNPECELNIVTNLMLPETKLRDYINKLQSLIGKKCIRRIDITCSIDCWGPEQEYVRWPLDLAQWEKNFSLLLTVPEFYLNINQTISVLTIKSMSTLLKHLTQWRRQHQVGHWFSTVSPNPDYLKPDILGRSAFESDIADILDVMPKHTEEDINAHKYMASIFNSFCCDPKIDQIRDMFVFLNEKDRRRGTDWRTVFPWLLEFENYVV